MRITKEHGKQFTAALPEGIEPLVVPYREDQKRLLEQWQEKLKNKKRLSVSIGETYSSRYDDEDSVTTYHPYGYSRSRPGRPYLSVNVENPYKKRDELSTDLLFNKQNELIFRHYSLKQEWHVSKIEHVLLLVEKVLEFFEEQHKKDLKNEKVQKLKIHSILAKLEEIAREDKFEFDHSHNSIRVTLFVKLPKDQSLSIQVPFKSFQEVMQEVRPIIRNILDMSAKGIVFQIAKSGYHPWKKVK